MDFKSMNNVLEVVAARDSFDLLDPNWHAAESRLRELLSAKYGDEDALCIKTSFMPTYVKAGFTEADNLDTANELVKLAEFVPRAYCEYNPLYKQIIPYVIGVDPDKNIYTMERIDGDARLIGKISLGIGGHINKIDEEGSQDKFIERALHRELEEEVKVNLKGSYLTFRGFIYDPSDNVGQDHLGFIYVLHTEDRNMSTNEPDKQKSYMSTKEELQTKLDRMENWSVIAFKNLFK